MTASDLERQYRKIGFWALILVILILVGVVLAPFASSLMWAIVLSVLTYPIYQRFQKRFNDTVSSLLTIFSTIFLVALPLALVGLMVFLQFRGVVDEYEPSVSPVPAAAMPSADANAQVVETDKGPITVVIQGPAEKKAELPPAVVRLADRVDQSLQPTLDRFDVDFNLGAYLRENWESLMERVTGPVTRGATTAVVSAVMIVIAFLTMFFMLRDGHKLLQPAKELLPLPPDRTVRILVRAQKTIHAVFMGVILVAFIQGVVATLGYAAFGIEGWLLWGAATTVLCAIPLLGSPIIYVPLSFVLLSQGKIWQGVGLLALGFIVISNIDNLLRPKYIGDRVGLHYISIFFSLLGGILAFGPVGLMAGPVLLTISLELIEYAREMRREGQRLAELNAENAGNPS